MLKQVFNFFEPPHKLPVPAAAASPVAAMSAAAATADPAGAGGADVALAAVDTDAAFIPAGGSQAVQQSAQNTSAKYMQDLAENYLTTSCSSSGTTSLTYLTADSTTGAADVAVPNASLRAAPAVSPFVAIAEDTMQAGFVLPDLKAPVALDRGTKSI